MLFNDLIVDHNRTKLARQEQSERSRKSITTRIGSWVVDTMQSSNVRAVYVPLECISPTYRSLGLYRITIMNTMMKDNYYFDLYLKLS